MRHFRKFNASDLPWNKSTENVNDDKDRRQNANADASTVGKQDVPTKTTVLVSCDASQEHSASGIWLTGEQ